MIVTGLVVTLDKSRYKWASKFHIFWNVTIKGRKRARALGSDVYRVYMLCGVWTLGLWLLYPVCWALCEEGHVIAPDSEAIFCGVLDSCAKPVFRVLLILGYWNINPGRMGLFHSDSTEAPSSEKDGVDGAVKDRVDRHRHATAATGADTI